jgi:hypothetical protein
MADNEGIALAEVRFQVGEADDMPEEVEDFEEWVDDVQCAECDNFVTEDTSVYHGYYQKHFCADCYYNLFWD